MAPHLAYALSVARRILRREDLANDAVQDSFVSLWRSGVVPSEPRGWLVRAVTYRSLCALRAEHRRHAHESKGAAQGSGRCPLDDPQQALRCRELREALHDGLAALPAEQREAFLLRFERGLEYEEIASVLSIPVGTVRSRLARARTALREALESHLPCERAAHERAVGDYNNPSSKRTVACRSRRPYDHRATTPRVISRESSRSRKNCECTSAATPDP